MPFVRISLRKDLADSTKEKISDVVHDALVQEFRIPQNDYFHIIEELDAHQIKYPKEYLSISHSDNIVFIKIVAATGRSVEQKRKLYSEIGHGISKNTNIRIEDIIIILIENDGYNNWSFGNGEMQKPKHI